MSRYINFFEEEVTLQVIMAYLYNGKSHRQIQREILGLPAPARGGGFIAMDILHNYNIHGDKKGLLQRIDILDALNNASEEFALALRKVMEYKRFEKQVRDNIGNKSFFINSGSTEITATTKVRINQSVLRDYVLRLYNNECALCNINKTDLLVCSHIKPWSIDEENRLNPSNAICFCVLHDKLFDKGYFSIDNDYGIIYGTKADSQIRELMNGLRFKKPKDYLPDTSFLNYHYDEICK
ncbi:MAG TPA: HNH endonuclease [Negativicutes bacterium]|nr:HNH endonuclease [Clostridia bacterium]HWR29004.1 HNH endonuclease [Negativicutes bacterium]